MSLLVLGISHHRAPLEVLEQVAIAPGAATEVEAEILRGEHVNEVLLLSTCNRTEVYADAATFHGGLAELMDALAHRCGLTPAELTPYLYVHYEERAAAHAFTVAAGLDSMAVGEVQVLGQLRASLRRAQGHAHVGTELNALVQQALRVGRRVHAETAIDTVSRSLVDAALTRAAEQVDLAGSTVLVLGAGGIGALAAHTSAAVGIDRLLVANRGTARAESLADRLGGESVAWADRHEALVRADVVLASTGARHLVLEADAVARAQQERAGRPLVLVDLALPRDIDPAVAAIPAVLLVDLAELGRSLAGESAHPEVAAASALVDLEVAEFVTNRVAASVAPTVSALRRRAGDVVAAELSRLDRRSPGLSPAQRAEVELAVHRVVEKLLHAPTVKVKAFAEQGQGGNWARALNELFDLDPRDVSLVSTPVPSPYDEEGRG